MGVQVNKRIPNLLIPREERDRWQTSFHQIETMKIHDSKNWRNV